MHSSVRTEPQRPELREEIQLLNVQQIGRGPQKNVFYGPFVGSGDERPASLPFAERIKREYFSLAYHGCALKDTKINLPFCQFPFLLLSF
ncbi:hypothetical protein CEXT_104641 [Caerostris extrusa]|uniref:Uncharacterized protein n=1 Tax=Caerostris extrusa TaxID=172846 RepID=A0AAV4QXY0_CAEEX|nr:hypothetical protein CEXT_104641 [Caerostris extrusa]